MPASIRQAAAVAVRDGLVCLVTSKGGRRWVIPKGLIDPGRTAREAALAEAWEEAGIVGILSRDPAGTYHYEKYGLDHHVTVFVMRVTEEKADWPERPDRRREWVSPEVAVTRVAEPSLRDILREVFETAEAQ
jgi:8-oxo-dGTP pyrophosphatase MutT (NUDIX family)